jgi:ribonuclease R
MDYAALIDRIRDRPDFALLQTVLLRSLSQAQYSPENVGHFGLAYDAYAHFTSPIRRYPDLLVHRALLAALAEGEEAPRAAEAREVAWHSSECERESARIERDADDVCAAYLLRHELDERGADAEFKGEVSGVIRGGAFVAFGGELGDVYEGFVPARTMGAERFELNETETALAGRESGTSLRLGDPISVRVSDVAPARGRVDLERVDG